MAGRKCKLNDELTAVICDNISLGLSYTLTCQAAGIHFDTFNEWMKKGEAGGEEKFVDFYSKVRAAEAICARNSLERIREAADNGTWNAAAWLLERRYPSDYGRKDRIDMKAKTENVSIDVTVNEQEISARRSSLLSRILGDIAANSIEENPGE